MANENKRFGNAHTQQTVDPLALMSNVSPQHYHPQSSTNPPTNIIHQPQSNYTSHLNMGLSPTNNLIENLTNIHLPYSPSHTKPSFLKQTINSNLNKPKESRLCTETGSWFWKRHRTEWGIPNRVQARQFTSTNSTWTVTYRNCTQPKLHRTLELLCFKDKMMLMQASRERVNQYQNLPLNVDNVFQADDCDAFDSDVDEAPTAQTMFMANLSSADQLMMKPGPSYEFDTYLRMFKTSIQLWHPNLNLEVLEFTERQRLIHVSKARCLELEAELYNLRYDVRKDNYNDLLNWFSNLEVVQIVLWYLDSGCSKHMTGDRSRLMNFVKKFIGTVRFGNDHFGAIMGYGDYVVGNSVISRVYYVEGLGHNLFSVGQFCDSDLEVAFRKHSCYVRDTDGVELLKGSRGSNLYTISVEDMMKSSPICLLSKASKNKSWLWHRRLNHLNFGTINDLARKDLVRGLPRLKFEKDHLCSACQLGKSKKHTHKPKTENTNLEVLNTLHMDLCGPMRQPPTNKELEDVYSNPMFDDNFKSTGYPQNPIPNVAQDPVIPTGPSVSIAIDLDAPSGSHTSSPH
ncbi:retrovirus-related pol polyprotein from transposon TNT 1-94 [Tanacetum coccineum]